MLIQKQIEIREDYIDDLKWSIWYLEKAVHVKDRERKISTLKEIIKDIQSDVSTLKRKGENVNENKD